MARLERLETERKAKLRKKKEELETPPRDADADDPKKAAIKAALERAAAKKAALAAQGVAPKNTEELTPAQHAQVDAAEARWLTATAPAGAQSEE